MTEESKTGIIILGALAVAGVGAYFLLKKPTQPPPPGEVSARIDSFTISSS